jgi:hypothetical protein
MGRHSIPVLVLACAAVVLAGGPATGHPPLVGVWDPLGAGDHLVGAHGEAATTCGGGAPEVTACSNGEDIALPTGQVVVRPHLRGVRALGTDGLQHGFPLPMAGYTGTLESRLVHALGARTFHCSFQQGTLVACTLASGAWPAEGSPFSHQCRSFKYGTTLPGGSGPWRCALAHDGAV